MHLSYGASPVDCLWPNLSRPLSTLVRNPSVARDRDPAEAEEKEQLTGSCGSGSAEEGQLVFTSGPGLSHSLPCLAFFLCVDAFSPTTHELPHGAGSLAAGLQKSSLLAPVERKSPSSSTQNHPGEHSGPAGITHSLPSNSHINNPFPPTGYTRKPGLLVPPQMPATHKVLCTMTSFNPYDCPAERYTSQRSFGSYKQKPKSN